MQETILYRTSYNGAVVLIDALESGLPYAFKRGSGEMFTAIVRGVKPESDGALRLNLEVVGA